MPKQVLRFPHFSEQQFRTVAPVLKRLPQRCSALFLVTVLSFSLGSVLSSPAIAATLEPLTLGKNAIELASDSGNGATQLPPPLASKLRQDLSQQTGIPPGKLRVVEATRRTWSDGCLGLAQPGENCSFAMVEGWRVVLSDGSRRWVYRTDTRGLSMRLETG